MERVGGSSSSVIVPVPVSPESAIVALFALANLIETVSSASSRVSPVTATVIVFEVSPAANSSLPRPTAS